MIVVYKYLHGLSLEINDWHFYSFQKSLHNIHHICLFGSENPWSVHFGVDAIAFHASQLWQRVGIAIKDSSRLEIFKAKIKLRSSDDGPCNLCKRFNASVG